MYGKGGSKLNDIVNANVFQKLIEDISPEIVVFQIGGTDLDSCNFSLQRLL